MAGMDVTEAVAAPMDDPRAFLAGNALTVGGGRARASGPRIWRMVPSTSHLTGCIFGAGRLASHLQPAGSGSGGAATARITTTVDAL